MPLRVSLEERSRRPSNRKLILLLGLVTRLRFPGSLVRGYLHSKAGKGCRWGIPATARTSQPNLWSTTTRRWFLCTTQSSKNYQRGTFRTARAGRRSMKWRSHTRCCMAPSRLLAEHARLQLDLRDSEDVRYQPDQFSLARHPQHPPSAAGRVGPGGGS